MFSKHDAAQAEGGIVAQFAAGLLVLILVVDVLRGEVVFDHLVLDDAHARLLNRQLGEADAGVVGGESRRTEDFVDLLLGVGGVDRLGGVTAKKFANG